MPRDFTGNFRHVSNAHYCGLGRENLSGNHRKRRRYCSVFSAVPTGTTPLFSQVLGWKVTVVCQTQDGSKDCAASSGSKLRSRDGEGKHHPGHLAPKTSKPSDSRHFKSPVRRPNRGRPGTIREKSPGSRGHSRSPSSGDIDLRSRAGSLFRKGLNLKKKDKGAHSLCHLPAHCFVRSEFECAYEWLWVCYWC